MLMKNQAYKILPGGQKFQGRTKTFNTIAENFCPRIKFFGGTIFFLTGLTWYPLLMKTGAPGNPTIQIYCLLEIDLE